MHQKTALILRGHDGGRGTMREAASLRKSKMENAVPKYLVIFHVTARDDDGEQSTQSMEKTLECAPSELQSKIGQE